MGDSRPLIKKKSEPRMSKLRAVNAIYVICLLSVGGGRQLYDFVANEGDGGDVKAV